MIKVKQIHSGQYERYGDSYYVYEIETDLPENDIIKYCLNDKKINRYNSKIPEHSDWLKACRSWEMEMADYFNGYYTITKMAEGFYNFTICKPYTD